MPWMIPVAIGASAAAGAAGSASAGKKGAGAAEASAQMQLQGTRESIAAQQRMANQGYGVFEREAGRARDYLTQQTELARQELAPLKEIGLSSLKQAQGFTDPNSPEAEAERGAYQKVLARNLSARGLTASGTEMAGLSDFELGLARERRNMSLGLAGVGANTLQSLSGLESGLGQGLAGISTNLGQSAMGLYGGMGQNMGNTLMQGAAGAGNSIMAAGQARAQGMLGMSNAFQGLGSNLLSYNLYQQMLGGGGGGGTAYTPLFGNGGF